MQQHRLNSANSVNCLICRIKNESGFWLLLTHSLKYFHLFSSFFQHRFCSFKVRTARRSVSSAVPLQKYKQKVMVRISSSTSYATTFFEWLLVFFLCEGSVLGKIWSFSTQTYSETEKSGHAVSRVWKYYIGFKISGLSRSINKALGFMHHGTVYLNLFEGILHINDQANLPPI